MLITIQSEKGITAPFPVHFPTRPGQDRRISVLHPGEYFPPTPSSPRSMFGSQVAPPLRVILSPRVTPLPSLDIELGNRPRMSAAADEMTILEMLSGSENGEGRRRASMCVEERPVLRHPDVQQL